jgi:hypothetical protein
VVCTRINIIAIRCNLGIDGHHWLIIYNRVAQGSQKSRAKDAFQCGSNTPQMEPVPFASPVSTHWYSRPQD